MNKKIVLYVIIALAVIGLLVMTFFPNMIYVLRDSGKSEDDKCATPEGKTDEEWKEHMGHHLSMYEGCLT